MNEAECRLRNIKGSEFGTCKCKGRDDCPEPPKVTPVGRRMKKFKVKYCKICCFVGCTGGWSCPGAY